MPKVGVEEQMLVGALCKQTNKQISYKLSAGPGATYLGSSRDD